MDLEHVNHLHYNFLKSGILLNAPVNFQNKVFNQYLE